MRIFHSSQLLNYCYEHRLSPDSCTRIRVVLWSYVVAAMCGRGGGVAVERAVDDFAVVAVVAIWQQQQHRQRWLQFDDVADDVDWGVVVDGRDDDDGVLLIDDD